MSKINIDYLPNTSELDISISSPLILEKDINGYFIDVIFSCNCSNNDYIKLDDFRFICELRKDNSIVDYNIHPKFGARYKRSYEDFIIKNRLRNITPDNSYQLYVSIAFSDQNIDDTFNFTAPRPPKLYESWSWNGTEWMAPKPYPDDNKYYGWDEEKNEWVEVEKEVMDLIEKGLV